jgi:hypothetical protein
VQKLPAGTKKIFSSSLSLVGRSPSGEGCLAKAESNEVRTSFGFCILRADHLNANYVAD